MRRLRSFIAGGAAAALVVAAASTALADNAVVDGDLATTNVQTTLALGNISCNETATGNVGFWITRNGEGNVFANSAAVTVSTSSSTTVASATGGEILIPANWSGVTNNTKSPDFTSIVTVTPTTAGAGNATITYTASGKDADPKAGSTPLARTVNLKVTWTTGSCSTNTAPSVSISGVTDGATYTYGDVPTAICEVSDAEDGNTSFPATLSGGDEGIGVITASCSHMDSGGLMGSASATYTVDPATPTVTVKCTDTVYTGDAQERCEATVIGVGDETLTVPAVTWKYSNNVNATKDGETASGTATFGGDKHYTEASGTGYFKIAKAESAVTLNCPGFEWFTGSAIKPCTATVTGDGVFTEEPVITYKGDTTKAGIVDVTAQYPGDANHNPSAVVSGSYEIKGFTLDGFYKPVDRDKVNTVKGGSTVPLKFEVFLNGVEQTSTSAIESFSARQVSCDLNDGVQEEEVDFTTTGGTSLRYDTKDGQFIQNWQTPKKPGTCYTVTMTTKDGGKISADFKLK